MMGRSEHRALVRVRKSAGSRAGLRQWIQVPAANPLLGSRGSADLDSHHHTRLVLVIELVTWSISTLAWELLLS
jgi:hypothetical protein